MLDIFMSYGEYKNYRSQNIKAERMDAEGLSCLLAGALGAIGLYGFRYSGLALADEAEKWAEQEAKKSGISAIASPAAAEWAKRMAGDAKKLRPLAQGFILASVMKHIGMPYKVTEKMFCKSKPNSAVFSKPGGLGFAVSFSGIEGTVVKKLSLAGAQEHEIGYFLAGMSNSALRLLIRLKGAKIASMQSERKDMKALAAALKKECAGSGFEGFMKIITICSAYDTMPFPTQRQFLGAYRGLPKPQRMKKVSQPIEGLI